MIGRKSLEFQFHFHAAILGFFQPPDLKHFIAAGHRQEVREGDDRAGAVIVRDFSSARFVGIALEFAR